MNRRSFLRFTGVAPVGISAGLAVAYPARADGPAVEWVGQGKVRPLSVLHSDFSSVKPLCREIALARRMRKCMSLRAKIDDIKAKVDLVCHEWTPGLDRQSAEWQRRNKQLQTLMDKKWEYEAAVATLERKPITDEEVLAARLIERLPPSGDA